MTLKMNQPRPRTPCFILIATLLTGVTESSAKLQVAEINRKDPVNFQAEILPILRNNCLPCHNRTRAKAEIILETPQDMLKGNDDGPIVVPGKPNESYLFQVSVHTEEPEMPPLKNKVSAKPLSPKELGLLKLWIEQGAKGEVDNVIPINWHAIATGIQNPIYAVAVSPDGQFAAAGRSNRIDVYHVPTGKHVGQLADDKLPNGALYKEKPAHLDVVGSLAFSPDSRTLASGSYREVKFWKLQEPSPLKDFKIPNGDAPTAISPDGKWLAAAQDKIVQLWDLAKGQKTRDLPGQDARVNALAFSADNLQLLSGSENGTLQSWNIADGKPVAQAAIADKPIASVAFLAEGKRLASGHADNIIRTWEARTEEEVKKLKATHDEATKALEAVNQEIGNVQKAAADIEQARKDAETALKKMEASLKETEAKAGEDKAPVDKARAARDQAKKTLDEKTKQAAEAKANADKVKADKLEPAKLKLMEAKKAVDQSGSYKMARELKTHSQPVTHLANVPTNGNHLFSGSKDGQAILWDSSKGSSIHRLALGKPISSIAVSADGKRFATAGDNLLRLWAEDGKQIAEVKGDRYALEKVAVSEVEAKFSADELKYREGELKKREDEKKKADERLKKAKEAKEKADKEPVAEKKAELDKMEKERDTTEKEIEATDKTVSEAQKKFDETEKIRVAAESAYKSAEAKVRQPTTLETQANQARDRQKNLASVKQRARDNLVNSQLKPAKQKVEQATATLSTAEKKRNDSDAALKTATTEVDKARQAHEAADKAASEAEAMAKKVQETADKPEPEKQQARQAAEAKRKIANDSKAAHDNLVKSKLNPAKQALATADKALATAKAGKAAADKALAAAGSKIKSAETAFAAADKTYKDAEKKAADAKVAADKVRATRDQTKKELDAKAKVAGDNRTTLDKLKKEKLEPAKKKLAELQKKIDNARKEFDKINGPLQTAIRELDNSTKDLARAGDALKKANELKVAADAAKKKREETLKVSREQATAAEKPVAAVAFSPDGQTITSTGDDQKLHTWGTAKANPHEVFGNLGQPGRQVAYDMEDRIISVSREGRIQTWSDKPTWKLDRTIGSPVGRSPLIDRVTSLAYSPDGSTLASGGGDPSRSGEVLLWNTADAKLKLDLSGIHSDSVLDIDFSPDGRHIATAAADKFVKVTEVGKGAVVRTFEGHTHHVMGVSWRRTGREILSSGADNEVKYWNFENGDRLGKGGDFKKEVTSIHFIGIGSEAIATSAEGKVSIVRSGSKISQATSLTGATKFVHASDVTPDGRLVAAGGQDGVLRIWTIADKKLVREFKPPESAAPTVAEAK